MPELAQDLTLAGLFLDQAEEKLLTAETRIEDARAKFSHGRPAA